MASTMSASRCRSCAKGLHDGVQHVARFLDVAHRDPHHVRDDVADLRIPDYKLAAISDPTGLENLSWWQAALKPLFKDGLTVKPRIMKDKCSACGVCRDACPMQAITMVEGEYAQIDDEECIRCYCCHEMCPEHAIELRTSLLYRIVNQ